MSYKVSEEFFKMFGSSSIDELPRYRLDENEQIVIDDLIEEEQTIHADLNK